MVFSQNELLIMIGVVSVLLLCITVLTILDIREYLKAKKGLVVEEDELGEEFAQETIEKEPVHVVLEEDKKPEELMVEMSKSNNNEIYFEEMDDEKFEVKEEIEPVIQEVKEDVVEPQLTKIEEKTIEPMITEVEEDTPKISKVKEETPQIMEVQEETMEPIHENKAKKRLELFEELDELEEKLPNKLDDVTNFEMEQERTAIISLDELLKKSDELYNDNEFVQYDDGNEPITIDEVISRFRRESEPESVIVKEEPKEVPLVMQEIEEDVVAPYTRKENIPFISSVYGIEKDNHALEFENTATYEKLDRQNYNDFMTKLREMNEKE